MNPEVMPIVQRAIVEVLELDPKTPISEETRLREDLGLDSLNSLALVLKIEELIGGLTIEPEELEPQHLNTVASLCSFIAQQMQQG